MYSNGISELVLVVKDVGSSARFYEEVVGLTPETEANGVRAVIDERRPQDNRLVTELLDKTSGLNLVDTGAPFGFNQHVYDRYASAPPFNHLSSRPGSAGRALGRGTRRGYGAFVQPCLE
jgi:hypothetical protein